MFHHEALELIYASLDGDGDLTPALNMIGQKIGADAADVVTEWQTGGDILTHGSFGFDPTFLDSYDEDFIGGNPWVEKLSRLGDGRLIGDAETDAAFWKSRYFCEWVQPQGYRSTIGAIVGRDRSSLTWIGFTRDGGSNQSIDGREVLEPLLPHFKRAIATKRRIDDLIGIRSDVNGALNLVRLPMVIFDAGLCIEMLNDAASMLLADKKGPFVNDPERLRFRDATVTERLRKLINSQMAADDANWVHSGLSDGRTISFSILPLTPGAQNRFALLANQIDEWVEIDVKPFSERYELTPSETRLAEWLVRGHTVSDYAKEFRISSTTARWHLKNLESKAGVTRLEQLVGLIHRHALPQKILSKID